MRWVVVSRAPTQHSKKWLEGGGAGALPGWLLSRGWLQRSLPACLHHAAAFALLVAWLGQTVQPFQSKQRVSSSIAGAEVRALEK